MKGDTDDPQNLPPGCTLERAQRLKSGQRTPIEEPLVVEKPLYFVVNKRPLLATMRTPGHDEELLTGYLATEGIIDRLDQLGAFRHIPGPRTDTLCATLHGAPQQALDSLRRVGASVSSCGVCGRQGQAAFEPRARGPLTPLRPPLERLPDFIAQMRRDQPLFELTGAIHAAALLGPSLNVDLVREDIGRHNAIDKAVGWLLKEDGGLQGPPRALISSGRASFEVVQKAAMANIGTVISVSAASSMAVDVARELGMLLIGFVRRDKALIYWDPDWKS